MNKHQRDTYAALLASLSLALPVHAAERTEQVSTTAASEARTLTPAQLTAIRGISRNVLAAKKSGPEDGADAAQLASLRASLDQLMADDIAPKNRPPVTLQGQESGEQRTTRERVASMREAARTDARAMAAQLRHRGELKAAHARSQPEQDTLSAGMPIGEQRARLFERWAQKLDAALAEDNADRAAGLAALREQLRATHGSVSNAPIRRGTPTLQAMPASFVPPKSNGDNSTSTTGVRAKE